MLPLLLCQTLLLASSQAPDAALDLKNRLLALHPRDAVELIARDPGPAKALLDDLKVEIDASVRSHRDVPEQRRVDFGRERLDQAIRVAELYRDATGETTPYRLFVARKNRFKGTVLLNDRKYREALAVLEPVRNEARQLDDRWLETAALTGMTYGYLESGDRDRAIEHGKAALEVARRVDDRAQTLALYNLGALYLHLNDSASSIEPLLDASRRAAAAGNDMWNGNALINLGAAYRDLGKREEARVAFEQALDALTRAGDQLGIGRSLYDLALLAVDRADYRSVQTYMERALPLIRQVDIRHSHEIEEDDTRRYNEIEERALLVLIDAYDKTGDTERASGHRTALNELRASRPHSAQPHVHPPGK